MYFANKAYFHFDKYLHGLSYWGFYFKVMRFLLQSIIFIDLYLNENVCVYYYDAQATQLWLRFLSYDKSDHHISVTYIQNVKI